MELYNKVTKKIVTESEFRAAYPRTGFPALLTKDIIEPFGHTAVLASPMPVVNSNQIALRDGAKLDTKGNVVQAWKVINKYTSPEAEAAALVEEFARAKDAKRVLVEAKRKEKETQGVFFNFSDGLSGVIQTRHDTDIRNIQAITTTGLVLNTQGVTNPVIPFRDESDVIHILTPNEAILLGMTVQTYIADVYTWSWNLKAQIDSASTEAILATIEVI